MAGEAASVNPVGLRTPLRAVKIAVRVATPSATPTCRTVILVPEAVALSSGAIPCKVAAAIGAKTKLMPTPAAIKGGTKWMYSTLGSRIMPLQSSPILMSAMPTTITGRVPTLDVSSPVSGETTRGARVHGMVISPASSGFAPWTTCKNCIKIKIAPKIPKKKRKPTIFAMLKLRLLKRRSGSRGEAACDSHQMKEARMSTPPIRAVRTSTLAHPASFPRTMP